VRPAIDNVLATTGVPELAAFAVDWANPLYARKLAADRAIDGRAAAEQGRGGAAVTLGILAAAHPVDARHHYDESIERAAVREIELPAGSLCCGFGEAQCAFLLRVAILARRIITPSGQPRAP
jgi:hypothetical protein